jgi:signal transduction histidine kinase/ligand-binding sensor domain-containing protein
MSSRGQSGWLGLCLALGVFVFAGVTCDASRPYAPVVGDPLLEPWRWRTFPDLSGLDVQCMTEGADGTIWFGTANGLWSYDGFDWVKHSDNVGRIVMTLFCDANGVLYAGGGWGISRLSNGKWTRLFTSHADTRIVNTVDIPVRKLACARDGSLWAATSWGALHWNGATWTLYTDPATAKRMRDQLSGTPLVLETLPTAVLEKLSPRTSTSSRCDCLELCGDRDGRVWFGTTSGQVLCYAPGSGDDRGWTLYGESQGVAGGVITSMMQLSDGTLWVVNATSDRANTFDGKMWRQVQLPLVLPASSVTGDVGGRLMQTRDGVIWLSTHYMFFAYRDGQWRKYELPQIPYPSARNVVMESSDGALWFSGANSEIHRVDYETPRWLTLEDLNFQWESPTGVEWFLHRSGRIVVRDAGHWTSLGPEDGLIDTPVAVRGTRRGDVWVMGSHEGTAATARLEGGRWIREVHGEFSFGMDWRAVFESSDGSMWLGAWVDTDGPPEHRDGILQFRDGTWIHHHQPGRAPRLTGPDHPTVLLPAATDPARPIEKYTCFGESRDGNIWAGRIVLASFDHGRWQPRPGPVDMQIESMLTTRERDLWVGSRESGAWRFDGQHWTQFQGKDSLLANSVRSLAQTADGSLWAATDRGFSRFDGQAWMADVLPDELNIPHEGGALMASPSGELWINRFTLYWMRRAWSKSPPPDPTGDFRTVRHRFQSRSPSTFITSAQKTVSQPGNLAVLWTGAVPWREPKEARLQFSYRLDGQDWSAFTSEQGHSFFTLPVGPHHLEVRARDADFNVDPTPATLDFVVLPPVWRQTWFILLMVLLGGVSITQTIRVLLEQRRLRRAHDELEIRVRQRTAELEAANRELEAFSYSVSHDLRAPLRSIDGFSRALLEDYSAKLDDEGRNDLRSVRAAAQRMGQLIEDMLKLSRLTRSELRMAPVRLTALVEEIVAELAHREPDRQVHVTIAPNVDVIGDASLLRIALVNLVGNAWKFTANRAEATIEFGVTEQADQRVYFVRDNGAGFDMAYANRLFGAFHRLHTPEEFPGTGVGLAIVQRVILRHSGRVWAEATVDAGATFYFTLGESPLH